MGGVPPADDLHPLHGGEPVGGVLLHCPDGLGSAGGPGLDGGGEGGNLGGGLGARAQPPLLPAADHQGFQLGDQFFADVKAADALGGTDLVAADGYKVRSQLFGGEGDLQKALHRVGVEKGGGACRLDGFGRCFDGQDGPRLIVYQHDGDKDSVGADGFFHRFRGNVSGFVRLQIGDLVALILQQLHRLQNSGMLDGGGDDVAAIALIVLQGGGDGPVVPLGAAGGEEQLFG